ncbi:hypothetical protein AWZ03_002306 [Drosophila navojoa]|uniref:Uncharacterized protein n=1 Tax=Drosophila navojoa TaxID=7232 RepID=A0A484BQX3_DRONA|nr:uncharacterized protein LOC115565773 [Drosophila navojoa]TDG51219.1 hypothetical protein AWZ03_002306 [Drosophila navojoa]
MDLYDIESRLMILDCLRENSVNMRIEQMNLKDRISQALVRARSSLLCIRQLNFELQEMKLAVDNALTTDLSDFVDSGNEIAKDAVEERMIEFIDGMAQGVPDEESPFESNEDSTD